MALRTEKVRVKGTVFEIRTLGTSEGLVAFGTVLGLAGPTLGKLLDKVDLGKARAAQGGEGGGLIDAVAGLDIDFAGAVRELSTNLAKTGALAGLGDLFLESTSVKVGDSTLPLADQYETIFAGRYDLWIGWVMACLRVNFPAFLSWSPNTGNGANPDEPTR